MRLIETRCARAASVRVVDGRPSGYTALSAAARSCFANLEFISRGRDALRLASSDRTDLWIVNVQLPDMSGLDLCAMLKLRLPQTTVYMVSDDYCSQQERAAWAHGASLFSAKPVRTAWLQERRNPSFASRSVAERGKCRLAVAGTAMNDEFPREAW